MRIQFQGSGHTAVLSLAVLTQLEKCELDTANHHAAISPSGMLPELF